MFAFVFWTSLLTFLVLYTRAVVYSMVHLRPNSIDKRQHIERMRVALEGNPYHHLSGIEMAKMVKKGEVTSVQLVQAHIQHIRAVNYELNAVVEDRFDSAMKEAEDVDSKLRELRDISADALEEYCRDKPYLGVPCTVKECFALEGMPQTSGLVHRIPSTASIDATVVSRLRKAGGIPMGVTNVSELCMWMESHNKVYGRTRNPFDPSRIVGGSSGGEGAIIGSGASPLGIGSDIGGSIRMPAFFNGVFGHKPTGGRVPGTGQYPIAQGSALRMLSTGPLCRKAEDLWPLLCLMQGRDGKDTECHHDLHDFSILSNQSTPSSVDFSRLTVYWLDSNESPVNAPTAKSMKETLQKCAKHLESIGCKVLPAKDLLPQLKYSLDIWSAMMQTRNPVDFTSLMANNRKNFSPILELLKWLAIGESEYTLPALALCLIEKLTAKFPARTEKFVKLGTELKQTFEKLMETSGPCVLLYPSYPHAAPKHGQPIQRPVNYAYTAIWNVLETPVTQVPVGVTSYKQLPLGLQVVGAPGMDHMTIAVAVELEKAFGGWQLPTVVGCMD